MKLQHIEPLVPPAMDDFAKRNIGKLQSQLIALRRIRKEMKNHIDDFVTFLKKIQKQDPELYIAINCRTYFTEKFGDTLSTGLFRFLENNGYGDAELSRLLINKELNEGAFLNRLPKDNINCLWLCIYYLYKPRLMQKFFWEKLEYLSKEEQKLIDDYRALPDDLQDRVSKYTDELATAQTLSRHQNKASPII